MPVHDLPPEPSLENLKNQARRLQRLVRAGDPRAIATVREFHPRPAALAGAARFSLADAQLVIARQYGLASWTRLRRSAEVVIRPVRSPRELARAFELIGARRAPALEQDRYFCQLARRFPEDQQIMVVAEVNGEVIGGAFAFRKDSSPACRTVTLRNVAAQPPYRELGLERRLIQRIEDGAVSLGVTAIILGGPSGTERQLLLGMGYRGRREGGFMSKQLPLTASRRDPGWHERLAELRGRRQSRLAARSQHPG
jgi:GNAT superfamily N-acetyltransferase